MLLAMAQNLHGFGASLDVVSKNLRASVRTIGNETKGLPNS